MEYTSDTFIEMAEREIARLKDNGRSQAIFFSIDFGSNYRYYLETVRNYFRNLEYEITTKTCRKKLTDITIMW